MKGLMRRISGSRIWSLIRKELRHIKRDHHLIVMLIVPPTIQLVIFGLAGRLDVSPGRGLHLRLEPGVTIFPKS